MENNKGRKHEKGSAEMHEPQSIIKAAWDCNHSLLNSILDEDENCVNDQDENGLTAAHISVGLSNYAFYGHIMLAWLAHENVDLKMQLQGHTSYYEDSQLRAIGSTYLATFGASININPCNQLDIAISEDIKVDASPDISLLINWRNLSGC